MNSHSLIPTCLDVAWIGLVLVLANLMRVNGMAGKRLTTCGDVPAVELHRLAQREPDRAAKARMQGIAGALEKLTRA